MKSAKIGSKVYKVGDVLKQLTVPMLHEKYFNKRTGTFERIEFFAPQVYRARALQIIGIEKGENSSPVLIVHEVDGTGNAMTEHEHKLRAVDLFQPNGDLYEVGGFKPCKIPKNKRSCAMLKVAAKLHRRWLFEHKMGPYKAGQFAPFYFLCGKEGQGETRVQVCAQPFNSLSLDCLDAIHMFAL